jgi:hypothetical protein
MQPGALEEIVSTLSMQSVILMNKSRGWERAPGPELFPDVECEDLRFEGRAVGQQLVGMGFSEEEAVLGAQRGLTLQQASKYLMDQNQAAPPPAPAAPTAGQQVGAKGGVRKGQSIQIIHNTQHCE